MRNKQIQENKSLMMNILIALPILIMTIIVPALIGYSEYSYQPSGVSWNPSAIHGADLFNMLKARGIIIAGVLSFLMLFFMATIDFKKFKKNRAGLIILSVIGIILISGIFSFNKYIAFFGTYERFEGILVWLSYLVCAVYTAWLFRTKELKILILRSILVGGLIVTTIGAFQYFGIDIFKLTEFQKMILPDDIIGKISFSFGVGRVYTTLYNPNYVAFYVAMMLPFSLVMAVWDEAKIFKALWVIYAALLGICLLGSEGRGGLLGFSGATAAIIIVYLLKKINRPKMNVILVGALTLCIIGGFGLLASGKISKVNGDTIVETTQVSDIVIDFDKIDIQYGKHQIKLKMDTTNLKSSCVITDENGLVINVLKDENNFFNMQDERFPGARYLYSDAGEGYYYIELQLDGISWPFIMQESGFKFINNFGALSEMKPVDHWGFEGSESLGSNRGYIWSRTLPMIAKSPIWGYGPDNYAYVFPQEEYVKKQIYYGNYKILVDKPHNFYLQMLTSFGLVGFIALYALFGTSISFLYNRFAHTASSDKWLYLGILCGIFGYLGAGLFYDSTVNVSPIFWTFIGVGLQEFFGEAALNKME